jgi:hypothetical protein
MWRMRAATGVAVSLASWRGVTVNKLIRENPSSAESSEPVTWGINPDNIERRQPYVSRRVPSHRGGLFHILDAEAT